MIERYQDVGVGLPFKISGPFPMFGSVTMRKNGSFSLPHPVVGLHYRTSHRDLESRFEEIINNAFLRKVGPQCPPLLREMLFKQLIDEHGNKHLHLEMLDTIVRLGCRCELSEILVENQNSLSSSTYCQVCFQRSKFNIEQGSISGYRFIRDEELELSHLLMVHHRDPSRFVLWHGLHEEFNLDNICYLMSFAKRKFRRFVPCFHVSSIINHAHIHLLPLTHDLEKINRASLFNQIAYISRIKVCKGMVDFLFTDQPQRLEVFANRIIQLLCSDELIPMDLDPLALWLDAFSESTERPSRAVVEQRFIDTQDAYYIRVLIDFFPSNFKDLGFIEV